jgi:crossover junction endodeoxyribonuclease RuvC
MALVQSQQFTGSGLRVISGRCCFWGRGILTQKWLDLRTRAPDATLRYTQLRMRVFGIDCGTEITGYGVVEMCDSGRQPKLLCHTLGAIRLAKAKPLPVRLAQVYCELNEALARWRPDVVAVEEVFYSVNAKSALKLGQVRGVALLAAASAGLPVAEYAPLRIKSSVVGYGLAKKEQVQFMVARLLELKQIPEPPDAADALAIAICHIHTAQTQLRQGAVG